LPGGGRETHEFGGKKGKITFIKETKGREKNIRTKQNPPSPALCLSSRDGSGRGRSRQATCNPIAAAIIA